LTSVDQRYAIWLTSELESGLVDFDDVVQPTVEEEERFADWPPAGGGFTFHRLKKAIRKARSSPGTAAAWC
jgi:hypothetical protein